MHSNCFDKLESVASRPGLAGVIDFRQPESSYGVSCTLELRVKLNRLAFNLLSSGSAAEIITPLQILSNIVLLYLALICAGWSTSQSNPQNEISICITITKAFKTLHGTIIPFLLVNGTSPSSGAVSFTPIRMVLNEFT